MKKYLIIQSSSTDVNNDYLCLIEWNERVKNTILHHAGKIDKDVLAVIVNTKFDMLFIPSFNAFNQDYEDLYNTIETELFDKISKECNYTVMSFDEEQESMILNNVFNGDESAKLRVFNDEFSVEQNGISSNFISILEL